MSDEMKTAEKFMQAVNAMKQTTRGDEWAEAAQMENMKHAF